MSVFCGRVLSAHEGYAKTALDSYHIRPIAARPYASSIGVRQGAFSLVVRMKAFLYIANIHLAILLA